MDSLHIIYLRIIQDLPNSIPLDEFESWLYLDEYGNISEPNKEAIVAALPYMNAERESIALRILAKSK